MEKDLETISFGVIAYYGLVAMFVVENGIDLKRSL